LTGVLFAAAFFFWARGTRKGSKGDLTAGPLILVALCTIFFVFSDSSAVFGVVGWYVAVFGAGMLLLSPLAKPNSPLSKRDLHTIGVVIIIVGLWLTTCG